MKRTNSVFGICLAVSLCFIGIRSAYDTRSVKAKTSPAECDENHCPAGNWFPRTPPPSNAKPDRDCECDFYQWAWQTFLFVTQPDDDGRPRFLNFETPTGLFGDTATPRFLKPKGAQATNKTQMLVLSPRLEKESLVGDLNSVVQADGRGVLVDQNGHVIYYGQHINSQFVKFVKDNGYTDMMKLKNAPADQTFPTGTLELKSSWKILGANDDKNKFFTTTALVARLVLKNGKIVIDPADTKPETVALVGLHVVGKPEGHPELVWATFEHNDNAPDLPDQMDPNSTMPVDTTRSWTLYSKGTRASDCNKKPGQAPQPPLTFIDQAKQILDPKVSVFRQFSFAKDPQILDLNNNVHAQLPHDLQLWKNYSLMGAVWLNTPDRDFKLNLDFKKVDDDQIKAHPEIGEKPELRVLGGDREISNTSMETFTQTTQSCFSCHKTQPVPVPGSDDEFPAKLITVSHVLTNAYINSQQSANLKLKTKH